MSYIELLQAYMEFWWWPVNMASQERITQDFELGAKQDDSGLGHAPQENFEFRFSQIVSDAIWDKLSKQHFDDTYLCPVTC